MVRFLEWGDNSTVGRSEPFSSRPPPKITIASKRSDGLNDGGWYQDSSEPISGVPIKGLDTIKRRRREEGGTESECEKEREGEGEKKENE